jgi:HAD superfamily hydrolase (TIGR01509 family)
VNLPEKRIADGLVAARHWVFDLDGTLTVPSHDFDAIRRALDIAPEADILEHLASLPAHVAREKHAWLFEHERELARAARPAPGASELVAHLHEAGARLGILTRNARELAWITLEAIGLSRDFEQEAVLGREDAAPKPSPEGLLRIAEAWQVPPSALVMVGDYRFDLECGRRAGAKTVLVNLPENPWPELADLHAPTCATLRASLGAARLE